ncbi:MAG: AraC family transcriptional regulator [Parafilimonas sp.]
MKQANKKIVQLSLYDEFDIKVHTFSEWPFPAQRHLFFEIIYILKGNGIHILKNEKFEYKQNDLFLLTPHDPHQFEVQEETSLCIITFNEAFFSPNKSYTQQEVDFSQLFKKLEVIYYNLGLHQQKIVFEREKELIKNIIEQLIEEKETKRLFHYQLIQNLIFLLLSFIARNLQVKNIKTTVSPSTEHLVLDVINYIQHHIYDKRKLIITHLAKTFGKSKESLLHNFKSATGKTIKEFITEYKLSMVKSRLLFSDMTVSEIANELDFTDESHLNKIFKSKLNMTPSKFREMNNK